MRYTLVTDMTLYLDENGDLTELPGPVLNTALFLGSIVAWVTQLQATEMEMTNVPCRRMPGRKRCLGEIMAVLNESDSSISWECPICGDNGHIRGWQNTFWDRRDG
jgi:hypothetical protein